MDSKTGLKSKNTFNIFRTSKVGKTIQQGKWSKKERWGIFPFHGTYEVNSKPQRLSNK